MIKALFHPKTRKNLPASTFLFFSVWSPKTKMDHIYPPNADIEHVLTLFISLAYIVGYEECDK